MNQTILFSPVGGTDPISATNYRDGALLHICRVYKPSKVILYLSSEMMENQKKDNRYLYCLDELAKGQQRQMEYQLIERPNLHEVQEFDYFYRDFRDILRDIYQHSDKTDRLLINISSGTPAMKSGLLVLQTLGEYPGTLIQVTTPERRINEHTHKNYDVKTLWELDEDNESGFENRCHEVNCPTLSAIKNEEIIKKHIAVYDYQAALTVADAMPASETKAYRDYLALGAARLLLDFKKVDEIQRGLQENLTPIREGDKRKYFEYALNLQVKLKRKEYADFLRASTPLIVDLFELALNKQFKIKVDDYCFYNKEARRWDERKLRAEGELLAILDEEYEKAGGFKFGFVYSDSLRALIVRKSQNQHLTQLVEDLREVESKVRNLAAHEIVSITEQFVLEKTGFTCKQILEKIKALFPYTGINATQDNWNSYDDLNLKIEEALKQKE